MCEPRLGEVCARVICSLRESDALLLLLKELLATENIRHVLRSRRRFFVCRDFKVNVLSRRIF